MTTLAISQSLESSGNSSRHIPKGWKYKRLKQLLRAPMAYGVLIPDRYEGTDGVPIIRIMDIESNRVQSEELERISPVLSHEFRRTLVRRGDLIISVVGTIGKNFIVPAELEGSNLSRALARIQLNSFMSERFLQYYMQSKPFEVTIDLVTQGAAQRVLNLSDLREFIIPCPPISEQDRLVRFLDRRVGGLSVLVAKIEKSLQLLREKRCALIAHYVTKGLEQTTKMKESSVSWIGKIPQHWRVARIRHVAKLESGHTPSRQHSEYWVPSECNIPWVSLADVWQIRDGRQEFIKETSECISTKGLMNSAARLLPVNTVILSRTASVGFSGILGRPMATTQDFANWICTTALLPEYLLYVFRAMANDFARLTMGSTHKTVYMPDIADLKMPLPPLGEQREIVKNIRSEIRQLDSILDKIEKQKECLGEYRQALITAAVTGQIDPSKMEAA